MVSIFFSIFVLDILTVEGVYGQNIWHKANCQVSLILINGFKPFEEYSRENIRDFLEAF